VVAALLLAAGGAYLLLRTGGRPLGTGNILVLDLAGEIPEESPDDILGRWFAGERRTLLDITRMLRLAERDRGIGAVLVRVGPLDAGWGKTQELRDAIASFGRSGKPVVASLEYAGTREYYLATGAGRIVMVPSGMLLLNGIAAHLPFARRALDRVGVKAELEHVGEYKSAGELFARETPSPEHLEAISSMLDDLYEQLVEGIAKSRKLSGDSTRQLVDRGLLSAQQALEAGLVDDLAYGDEVTEWIRGRIPGRPEEIPEEAYLRRVRSRRGGAARIAIVHVTGTIVPGRSARGQFGGPMAGSETIARALTQARSDPGIRAIILRVDSPGGSGSASDIIWRETQLARRSKPLVVSMSDLAASGGYWVSMGADAIVAEPATLTGSIGVVGGKFDLGGFYRLVGIHWEVVQRGRNADLFTDVHGFSEEQRRILRENLESFYRLFLEKVADGRNLKPPDVERVAGGRVWTGHQALERGLVDRLGGLEAAVESAREKAKIPKGKPLSLEVFPRGRSFFEALREGQWTRSGASLPPEIRDLLAGWEVSARFPAGDPVLLLPEAPPVR
jgi:protease-4